MRRTTTVKETKECGQCQRGCHVDKGALPVEGNSRNVKPFQDVVEDGIKQGESLEAWTAEKPNWINAGLVEKLMVIGGYLLTFKYI